MTIAGWLLAAFLLLFGLTAFRGAPYIPTRRRQVAAALDLLGLKPGEVVVDLGSGDGVFLRAAAGRGLKAYGYEINPVLCIVSWWRCRCYAGQVSILWRDFWLSELPPATTAVFIFAAGPFMPRLTAKLERVARSRPAPLYVASHGFVLPGHQPVASRDGVFLFKLGA